MTQVNLPIEIAERLAEVMEATGLPNFTETITFLLDYYDGTIEEDLVRVPQTIEGELSAKASASVDSILNFNAALPLTVGDDDIGNDTPVDILNFDDLPASDKLVELAAQMGEAERGALAFIYTNIPIDMWGTDQAHKMWDRQIYFDKARGA